ncbi:PucR family transcriptional regulator [Acetobacterium wieringae]|uniref:Carbohydrate diacid regulator n=1 Tax=Acetobacterium wieringae TaxID=52694 RepID=A0A1F2PEW4_9FIRM|nr:helix-turn-helix domain-containing protein [Acetobacterium wieringae]OFV69231.1 carbohydrate diacid regulator [Acetobacterium wieringae]
MELSLNLIKEKLADLVIDYKLEKSGQRLHLQRPVFYQDQKELDSNTLYIAQSDQLPADLQCQVDTALILIGSPAISLNQDGFSYLVISETVSIFELSNRIHQIYDFFEIWNMSLQKSIRENKPLQYLIDLSEPVFENGITIMNPDFYIIARTSLTLDFNLFEELKTDEFGRLQPQQVNSFKNDLAYQKIKNEKEVFIYPKNILPYRTLCKNIFHHDSFLFRLVVCENIHPFSESDAVLLEHLGKYLTEDSEYLVSVNRFDDDELIELLNDMVAGKAYHLADFEKELKRLGWELNHFYCVAYVLPSDQDIYNQTLTYFGNKIRHNFEEAFAFAHKDHLIVLFNLSRIKNRQEFFDGFNVFIKASNFKIGYSNESNGLGNFRDYFKEAQIALDFGGQLAPQNDVHQFSDYVLLYLLSQMTRELPVANLNAPILSRLSDYDDKNSTEYIKTLTIYLQNNMNALQTAKDLSIHRGTMVYRLERIREIGKIDFENPDELLHVNISLKLHNNLTSIKPVKENTGEEFAEQILADLIAKGYHGKKLLKKFKEEQKKFD